MIQLLTRYVKEAPLYVNDPNAQFVNLTNAPGWTRVQVLPNQWTTMTGNMPNPHFWNAQGGVGMTGVGGYNASGMLGEYYANNAQLKPTDPGFVYFDPSLYGPLSNGMGRSPYCKVGGDYCNSNLPPGQWIHNPEFLQYDVRYEYKHPDPALSWIASAGKFQISVSPTDYTNTYNRAYFRIPARYGPGNYMAWYIWQGYSDIIDINVQPVQHVVNRYGTPTSGSSVTYSRLDHCELNFVGNSVSPCRRVNPATMDISQCVADCSKTTACTRIQVTRATNLPSLKANYLNTPVNIPFLAYNQTADMNDNMVLSQCGFVSIPLRYRAGCRLNSTQVGAQRCIASDYLPTDYVCYTTGDMQNTTLQATPGFAVVDEPDDPRYYSTCILKGIDYGFPNVPKYPLPTAKWTAAGQCIPCSFLNQVNSLNNHTVPNWEPANVGYLSSNCMPCN